jgi:ParB-like chromosome segregation protein Spo0J
MKKQVNIAAVKENPDNPRFIKDAKFKKLVKSIKGFPEMLEKRPIVVDEDMVVLGGNMRLKACKSAGLFEVWVDIAEGWTEDQKREFIVKDNVGFGEWDWDILANEWDVNLLDEWGLDLPKDIDEIQETNDIDDYGEVEFSDEILLEHNYIVLYFDNPMDWR